MNSGVRVFFLTSLFLWVLSGCHLPSSKLTTQQEIAFEALPPVPSGKSRVVLVFESTPQNWRIFPLLVSIDQRLALEIRSFRRFAVIDVEPGIRSMHFGWGPSTADLEPLVFDFRPQGTGYFVVSPVRGLSQPHIMGGRTLELQVDEITATEAARLVAGHSS